MINVLKVVDIDGKQSTRYERFCGRNTVFLTRIRNWGKTGVVKTRSWSTTNISYRGTVSMIVGYNHNSGEDVYSMWYPGTNRLHQTRDVIWLKKIYHEMMKQGAEVINSEPNVGSIKIEGEIDD